MIFDHRIDPILVSLGPFTVRYYGLLIVFGILVSLLSWRLLLKNDKEKFTVLFDLLVWLIIGGTIGARLGHVFFYEWSYYSHNLLEILMIHRGGLSSHGLTIGLAITFILFIQIKHIKIRDYIDLVIIPIPLLVVCIRLANFINSEIVGRVTGGEWGVRFHLFERSAVLRHPSQLYEAFLGLFIFVVVLFSYKYFTVKKKIPYVTFSLFIFLYFTTRFLVEFFKEYQTLSASSPLTMGQYLSIPFIVISLVFFVLIYMQSNKGSKRKILIDKK